MPTLSKQPLKVIRDRRLAYLVGLEKSYQEMGYTTKLDGRCNILEVFPAGYIIPKTEEQLTIEKYVPGEVAL